MYSRDLLDSQGGDVRYKADHHCSSHHNILVPSVVLVNLLTSVQPSLLTIVFETARMKIIVGLLLVATALAYPVAENEEKSNLPLVITDYSSVAEGQQLKQQPAQDSAESGSASSESEESSEKPAEAKPILEEKNPAESQPTSEEGAKSNESPEAEKPKLDLKAEEPAAIEPLKEEKKEVLEAKPSEPLPTLKVPEPAAPILKSIPAESQAEPAATTPEAIAQITNKPDVATDKLEENSPAAPASIEEKPLALPAEEKPEESPKAAATEIKEEIALPSEQKLEVSPAAEEKVPEIKTVEALPEVQATLITPVAHFEDKKDLAAVPAAEIKSDSEKRSKSEDIPKVEEKVEEKKPEEQQPQEQKPSEDKPAEEKAPEQKQAEGKSEDLPVKPLEEAKPTEAVKAEEKTEEPKQEPLPTASASSSS